MEPNPLLHMLRRRGWSIACWCLGVAALVGVFSYLRTPVYQSSAQVLLRPNDPTESLNPLNQPVASVDPVRNANAQAAVIKSPAVARAAAAALPDHPGSTGLLGQVHVDVSATSNVVTIVATSADPAQAQAVANAFAAAYIENRRKFAISKMRSAVTDIGTQLTVLQEQIASLDSQINGGIGSKAASPTDGAAQPITTTTEGLKAARDAAAAQYETLFSKQGELKVDISLKRGEAELVSPAELPASPISPKPARDAALGGLVGLLLGVGIASLREQFDDKVHSAEELEQVTGRPVLAEIPDDRDSVAIEPPAALTRLSEFSEAIRTLRTSLQFLGIEDRLRSIVVTSASPGDGKTIVSANLAVAYAQAGFRTVLVSGDLRRPHIEDLFGSADPGQGLSALLAEAAMQPRAGLTGNGENPDGPKDEPDAREEISTSLLRHLRKTRIDRLALLPAGPTPPNPAELLGSNRMRQVLDALSAHFDVVIIDSPPALAVTDPIVLGAAADGVLVVVSAATSTSRDLKRLLKTLDAVEVPLLGSVLNRVSPGSRSNSAYYSNEAAQLAKRSWSGRRKRPLAV